MNPNNNKVLDVEGGKDVEGQPVLAWNKHGKANQRWRIIYLDKAEKMQEKGLHEDFGFHIDRPFYIVSEMGTHRYLSVINNRNLAIKTQHGRNTQEWYFHQPSKTIRTKLNNQSFDIHSSGNGKNMQIWSTNSHWW
jgi:hypothetical protein